ncbi:uncharacterized protein C8R40DRAFT_1171413 [Lentinula edodes]|uniref:uncharacterized protein n=1 Tax=Lentinula edodes TaxID=5353 RepID=UPI001E8E2A28|nr:uncharacterized protein C8R40DRAFT_1171413 [Lentinula edodes]KAH7874310.1 hypothetical protein C8R40DRAFT_1171413 [Lentinula edodes]
MTDNDGMTSQQEEQSPPQSQNGDQQQQDPAEGPSPAHQLGGIDDPPLLSQSCMSVIQKFEHGKKVKVTALLEIQALLAAVNLSQEALTQSFSLYIKLLDSIKNQNSRAAEHKGNSESDIVAMTRKRPIEEEEEESEDDINQQTTSRQKINETVLPWLNRASSSNRANLSKSLEKT